MRVAAQAHARGHAVRGAPPSLRVWTLTRAGLGPILGLDLMGADYSLVRELECYAAAHDEEKARRHRAEQARSRRRGR